jgi:glutaredoxin
MGDKVILEKEKEYLQETTLLIQSENPTSPQVFIDQLFKTRGAFSFDEIKDEVNSMILLVSNQNTFQ